MLLQCFNYLIKVVLIFYNKDSHGIKNSFTMVDCVVKGGLKSILLWSGNAENLE